MIKWIKGHKLISALTIVILAGFGAWGYEAYAKHQNKVAFEQARTAIDTIYADIVTQIGQPDDYKLTKNCSYVQEEFGNGPLSCFIDLKFIYPADSKQLANQVQSKVSLLISNQKNNLVPVATPITPSINTSSGADSDLNRSYYKINDEVECVASYVYDPSFDTQLTTKNSKKEIYIDVNCSGHAKSVYYQLQK